MANRILNTKRKLAVHSRPQAVPHLACIAYLAGMHPAAPVIYLQADSWRVSYLQLIADLSNLDEKVSACECQDKLKKANSQVC